ncbi:MAG: HlyC/CorC family transporter [Wenzhouxiangellaceae bacterium]
MNEDRSSNGSSRTWLERITSAFTSEVRDRDELITELRDAHQRGLLDNDALAMAEGALRMGDLQVRDVMIPRSQMMVLQQDADVRSVLPYVVESGHSRFPVVGEDKDEVVGIILAKDLLRCFIEDYNAICVADLIREAVFIPESKRLNVLLREFRINRNHMAVVVDEYGGVSGLITIEDVLEEIVGDIDDEYDEDEEDLPIQEQASGSYLVQALTPIEDFNEAFATELSDEEFDTIGGLVLAEFGRLPLRGESVEIGGLDVTVQAADNRRIHQLLVQPPT